MKLITASDVGRRRAANEDCVDGKIRDQELGWAAVCDGMGGEKGGAVASQLACDEIRRVLEAGIRPNLDEKTALNLLTTALKNANACINQKGREDINLSGMGTTAVIAMVAEGKVHLMHAGDSRAYKVTKNEITQLTKDHSVVQMLLDRGEITPEQAKDHRDKHLITKAVGVEPDIQGDYSTSTLEKGEILLLCSDGLYNMIDMDELHRLSLEAAQADDASALIKQANQMGGLDNITAAIVYAD